MPKEWIDKFKGQFDQGWDKYREECFKRQLKLGVIPADTKLTPRPEEIPAYDSLTPDQKKVAARLMETFAAFTAQTDYEVGRLLDTLEEIGQTDNTLVIWMIGDNGASLEGGLHGCFNEMTGLQGIPEDPKSLVSRLDEIGGPNAYNHYPVGWAWAMNTPFQWGKQVASHFGGTRNPMVVSWPKVIKDAGGLRTQFHHCIDVVPTILEAAGIPEPVSVNGVAQKPIEGISMLYSFGDPKAKGQRPTQYFEMFGNRALYHDGWVAACRHGRLPWQQHRLVGLRPRHLGALQHRRRLQRVRRHGGQGTGEAEGAAGSLLRGGGQVRGAAARRPIHRARQPGVAAEPDRRGAPSSPTTKAPIESLRAARRTSRTGRTRSRRTSTCRRTAATACWSRREGSWAVTRST